MGDIGIYADRFQYVDFTEPYMMGGLVMIVKEETRNWKQIWIFMKTFTTPMWIILPIFHLVIMSVVWFVRDRNDRDLPPGIPEMLWFAVTVIFYAQSKSFKAMFDNHFIVFSLLSFHNFKRTNFYEWMQEKK